MNLIGGIAQLGERLNGIQEVSSSILLISTSELRLRGLPAKPFLLGGTLLHISQNPNNLVSPHSFT
jgi:hypothetical protein